MSDIYDFRFENSINLSKQYIQSEGQIEHKYSPWRTNTVLSNFIDTIIHSNNMNLNPNLPHKLQYDYLFYSVKPKKRFFKRIKTSKNENFDIVQQYYKYNTIKTLEVLKILTPEQIKILKQKDQRGGVK